MLGHDLAAGTVPGGQTKPLFRYRLAAIRLSYFPRSGGRRGAMLRRLR